MAVLFGIVLLYLAVTAIVAQSPHTSLSCQACSGQSCKGHVAETRCGHPSDLCMTSVQNKQDGTQIYSKRCASVKECDDKWLKDTALKAECVGFNPDVTYTFNFNCTYCCQTDRCNRDNRPKLDSLYLITDLTKILTTKQTTVSTTKPTTKVMHGTTKAPVKCEVCDGQLCGLFAQTQQTCPSLTPYCMNIVVNSDTGDKAYTKKCASFRECQTRWWEGSSGNAQCTGYDNDTPYYNNFQCVYCCTTSGCNAKIYPDRQTLFKGRS